MTPRGETCRFYWSHSMGDGFCRRYPPTVIPNHIGGAQNHFPVVYETAWCGEHADRERT